MNIQNSIEKAAEQKRGITREAWGPNPIWIIPTNTSACMIMMSDDKMLSTRWNPLAEDITATDWIVFGSKTNQTDLKKWVDLHRS